ncbi:hypothetical protein N9Z41_02770 [bacterium]|nr:hypothetical protein [bacterium]
MSDCLTVLGTDGIRRSYDEHYDTMMDVEQDPTGAFFAIQKQAYRIEKLVAENKLLNSLVADAAIERAKELEAKLAKVVEQTLDVASAYLKQQYGLGALSHPVDRGRIIAELKNEGF